MKISKVVSVALLVGVTGSLSSIAENKEVTPAATGTSKDHSAAPEKTSEAENKEVTPAVTDTSKEPSPLNDTIGEIKIVEFLRGIDQLSNVEEVEEYVQAHKEFLMNRVRRKELNPDEMDNLVKEFTHRLFLIVNPKVKGDNEKGEEILAEFKKTLSSVKDSKESLGQTTPNSEVEQALKVMHFIDELDQLSNVDAFIPYFEKNNDRIKNMIIMRELTPEEIELLRKAVSKRLSRVMDPKDEGQYTKGQNARIEFDKILQAVKEAKKSLVPASPSFEKGETLKAMHFIEELDQLPNVDAFSPYLEKNKDHIMNMIISKKLTPEEKSQLRKFVSKSFSRISDPHNEEHDAKGQSVLAEFDKILSAAEETWEPNDGQRVIAGEIVMELKRSKKEKAKAAHQEVSLPTSEEMITAFVQSDKMNVNEEQAKKILDEMGLLGF